MRGKTQRELPWLYWAWCYAHRLELACKDALSSQLFKNITIEHIKKHVAEAILHLRKVSKEVSGVV